MDIFVDVSSSSLNKNSEELCGDKVEIIRNDDKVIVVMADGLGSGVKANILSTLTSKIIGTMLSMGATIDEAVETIASTLPLSKERGLAYSTFSILQVDKNGESYLVEFDNPSVIRLVKGKYAELEKHQREIYGKKINESRFKVNTEDVLILVSDGVVNAGVGHSMNLGWQWNNIKDYIEKVYKKDISSNNMSKILLSVCNNLYENEPGDDTTVVTVKIRNSEHINVMIGPPVDKKLDNYVINKFINSEGKKVICGGTTSQIVSRETGREIVANFNYIDPTVPPTASISGIDLTTEGILTMSKVLEYAEMYTSPDSNIAEMMSPNKQDGASKLAKLLLEESTSVHFIVGRAINPAHQNPDFPLHFGMKLKVVDDIRKCLKSLGKKVTVEYY